MIDLAQEMATLSPEHRELLLLRLRRLGRQEKEMDRIERQARGGDTHPVSFSQERFWFLDQLTPGNPADHIPASLRVAGPLDRAALKRSLDGVVARHEALRTSFLAHEGEPVQRIAPAVALDLPLIDLDRLGALVRDGLVRRLAFAHHHRPFDLRVAPLLRAVLLRLAPEEHVLLLTVHHIVADGWSLGVLIQEAMALYQAGLTGRPSPLPEPAIQYLDYALWQRRQLASGALEGDLAYWRRQIGGGLPTLDLPTDRPRPAFPRFVGARRAMALDGALRDRLTALALSSGSTLFMVLLAAFSAYLSRLAGQPEAIVGSPVANRNRKEVEDLIGFFVNLLVMRTDLAGDPDFRALLGRVHGVVMEALAHQDLPFEKLVEEIQPERDPSRPPLFQVMFALQNVPLPKVEATALVLSRLDLDYGTAQYDLSLVLFEAPQGIVGWLEYNSDLFDATTVARMGAGFETLLAAAVAHPEARLSDLPVLGDSLRQQVLREWNDTAAVMPSRGIHELFAKQVLRTPENVAVLFEEQAIDYAELDRRASRLARALAARGIGRENRVGVAMERSVELVVALLAVLKAGAAYVPLDPAYPVDRLAWMAEDAGVALVLAQPATRGALPDSLPLLLVLPESEEEPAAAREDPWRGVTVDGRNAMYVMYTSGSTGRPKGVINTHGGLCNRLLWMQRAYGLDASDRVLHKTPFGFDVSVWELFWPLLVGARLVVARPGGHQDPAYLARLIVEQGVTTLHFVPSMLRIFLEAPESAACRTVRRVIASGEALPPDLVDLCAERLPGELHNLYGPTEAAIDVTAWHCRPAGPERAVPIGRPIANTRIHLLDAGFAPVPPGARGELYIAGHGLARGYLGRPERTAASFLPDPWGEPGGRLYRTGDLALTAPDGRIEFLGRNDHQVKVRGFRIELGEIEAALALHPAVRQAVVLLTAGRAAGERALVAYLVLAPAAEPSHSELVAFLRTGLPDYMLPAAFVPLPALPLSPNGKLDRGALPRPEQVRPELAGGLVTPRSPVEEMVAAVWSEVLGVDVVGVYDNFFELGGHSLLGTRLIARLSKAFDVDLSLRALFEAPTVAGLSAEVERLRQSGSLDPSALLPAVQAAPDALHEPFPLTDVQQAYWVGRSGALDLGNVAAHVYREVDVGGLDLDRFAAAVQRVIDRHGMLRVVVLPDGRQKILDEVPPYRLEVLDLSGEAPERAAVRLAQVRERMSHQVLPTDRWPLFEVRASRLDERRTRLHISLDLLIVDAWSSGILGREVLTLYQDPAAELPPLAISFRDYVLGEMALRETDLYRRSLDYWRRRIADLPPAPDLPSRGNMRIDKPHFVRRLGELEPELWRRIKARGTRLGLTPSGLLLAAFSEILATWCASPRFTINLTLYNRLPFHPQVNELVGDFTSLVLLGVDYGEPGTFEERARGVQRQLWDDLDHRYVSGVQVQRDLIRARRAAAGAVMPIVFTSTLNFTRERVRVMPEGLEMEAAFGISQTSQVLLDHQVVEEEDTLFFIWDGVEEAFPEGLLLRDMFEAYARFLRRLGEDEEAWTEPSRSHLPDWQRELLAAVDATAVAVPPATLDGLFLARAREHPERPAVFSPSGDLTYGELSARSHRIGNRLREFGVRPNTLVAVVMEKGWEQAAATLGILLAGAAYLPIDPATPGERLAYLLRHGEVAVALTQERFLQALGWPPGVLPLAVDGAGLAAAPAKPLAPVHAPGDLAYVIYTSGSTGLPKGVMIDHRGAVNTILDVNRRFGVGPEDRVLALSSLSFDLSVYDLFGLFATGGAVVFPESSAARSPERWLELLAAHGVTIWNSVPALLEMLAEYAAGRHALPESLRLVLLSGDWIPLSLPGQVRELAPAARLVSLGGATEASIWSILYPIAEVDPAWNSVPYGRAMANQTFHVLDRLLAPRPVWVPGDLYIGGSGLALGYWRDEAKTRASFLVHPRTGERLYRTGDRGRLLPDGDIEFLGREDLQVKIQGYRIELGEVEAALGRHPAAAVVAVAAVGERGGRRLAGFLVVREGAAAPAAEELRAFLHERLPAHMVPATFACLDTLPLTANGKVDRQALAGIATAAAPEPDAANAADAANAEASAVARRVAEIVAAVLGLPRVDLHTHLLELGAGSVEMVRIANQLEDEFGFRPRLDDLFRRSLAEAVAAFYEARLTQGDLYPKSAAADVPADVSALLSTLPSLRGPEERERFKTGQPGLRAGLSGPSFPLAAPPLTADLKRRYRERRSVRDFAATPVPAASLGHLLSPLRQRALHGAPKYLYGSAGGLYPVQLYAYVKPDRVQGLAAGTYYYAPVEHTLHLLSGEARLDRGLHAWVNQEPFAASAFSLFLVLDLAAIAPLYGSRSRDFGLIEAGLMTQLLEDGAAAQGIGLCQIGEFAFDGVRDLFALRPTHLYLHGLLGGALPPVEESAYGEVTDWEAGSL